MAYSFYPHPWTSTSFPQVGPNPKWFVFSVKVDQLSHLETKSVVWRCIIWYLKNLLHPRNLKSLPLKNDGWNSSFRFGLSIFRAFAVSFREGYYLPQFKDKVWQLIASIHQTIARSSPQLRPLCVLVGRYCQRRENPWVESQKWLQFGGGVLKRQSYKLIQNNSKSLFWHIFDIYMLDVTQKLQISKYTSLM